VSETIDSLIEDARQAVRTNRRYSRDYTINAVLQSYLALKKRSHCDDMLLTLVEAIKVADFACMDFCRVYRKYEGVKGRNRQDSIKMGSAISFRSVVAGTLIAEANKLLDEYTSSILATRDDCTSPLKKVKVKRLLAACVMQFYNNLNLISDTHQAMIIACNMGDE
jgi:hypothetical protein